VTQFEEYETILIPNSLNVKGIKETLFGDLNDFSFLRHDVKEKRPKQRSARERES